MNSTEEYRLKYIMAAEGKDRAQHEASLLKDDNERLRHALKEACDMRAGLCRNSDDDEPPKDPATWDKPLQRWLKALATPNAIVSGLPRKGD